ncbi:MAG TPA: class I SAM-dependent methyltransferase [Candidatus Nanoarchaeia archaeon]|nr:class I SAM-dependent methyltransferase [Candidatus Nanoarchaeia archaeon]
MNREEHYRRNIEYFRESALYKNGYYDAKAGRKQQHSIWQKMERGIVFGLFKEALGRDNIAKVADLGCGNGDFTLQLAMSHPSINFFGGDFSKEGISLAKTASKNVKNIKFKSCNIVATGLHDGSFDLTICMNTLHHIHKDDLPKSLKELARITRKYLIVEIKNANNIYNKRINDRRDFPHNFTTEEYVETNLKKFGFKLEKSKPIFLLESLSPIVVLLFRKIKNA